MLLFVLMACFPKQPTTTINITINPSSYEASVVKHGNMSLAMAMCRERLVSMAMAEAGNCKTVAIEGGSKTLCSGTLSGFQVKYDADDDRVYCSRK